MVAILVATGIVPLAGEQMQTFPHRRYAAEEDGEHPSKSDSPIRAHGNKTIEGRNRDIRSYAMVMAIGRSGNTDRSCFVPRPNVTKQPGEF
jgi:hypothetical protein